MNLGVCLGFGLLGVSHSICFKLIIYIIYGTFDKQACFLKTRTNTCVFDILTIDGGSLLLKYPNFEYFELLNIRIHDITKN